MTSRPGPGTQEPLHLRGGGPAHAPVRRLANPQLGHPDPPVDGERAEEDGVVKARPKGKILSLQGLSDANHGDAVRQPPRGRPEHFFSNAPSGSNEHHARAQTITNLPVPPRPGSSVSGDGVQQRRILPGGTGVKDDLTGKPQAPDTPSQAVMFPGGKTADLFPWTGDHPEDVLSEVLVKSGMSNKSQIMNETNTARPSLWSNLKNKPGMSTLSTLFVSILDKRQSSSRSTAPHTFKPPPRLTLRDSTRETWLKDLANPTVRLARLSRTIPTGVTGKVLLEQCLNKNIPIPRAMWLIKCIGINEIRTHKRKGQSGANNHYNTWVRGWTSAVEQFLEGIVATIGQEDWKARITYAIHLAANLFRECLLEEDHYLDWVLKSLDASSPERLFFWLLVVSAPYFWDSLISSRRRGKRLAESLLGHAEKLYALDETQFALLLDTVENTVRRLVLERPACLLLPKTWTKHGHTLGLCSQRKAEAGFTQAVDELNARNAQLAQSSDAPLSKSKHPLGQLYHLLDSVDYGGDFRFDKLASDCMEIISDAKILIPAAIQWASSIYRQGSHRIYLVTRLLRKWSQLGADIYKGITDCMPTLLADSTNQSASVFRIIAELVRSKTFNIGRYLMLLVGTGVLNQYQDIFETPAWPLRLLTEMPLSGLSENVQFLRRGLLHMTNYSLKDEETVIYQVQQILRCQLTGIFNHHLSKWANAEVNPELVTQTARLETCIWLRKQVIDSAEYVDSIPTKDPSIEDSGTVCQLSLSDFLVIREYMEQFDDLAMMADVVEIVATSFDSNVLSAAADTLNYHHAVFRAIGAFDPIFEMIATRYAVIRTRQFPERELLHSLISLSHTARADPQLVQLLRYDMGRYDQKNVLSVCSPVSDNMPEGAAAPDVEEEIERILSSGTSMDQQMMTRIFGKIAKYMEERLSQGNQPVENFSTWLFRLRCFEESTFDTILNAWLRSLLMADQQQLLSVVLPPLVASGSLKLALFLSAVRETIRQPDMQAPKSIRIGLFGLQRIVPMKPLLSKDQQQDHYRYRLEQDKFCRQRNSGLVDLVRDLTKIDCSAYGGGFWPELQYMLCETRLLDIFRHLAILEGDPLAALIASSSPRSMAKDILDRLLQPNNFYELSDMTKEQQIARVVQCAGLLSLPFCQLELRYISSMSPLDVDEEADRASAAMVDAIKTAIDQDQPCLPTLVSGLEPGLMCKIREHAEREILNASQFLLSGANAASAHEHGDEGHRLVQKYLGVIDAAALSDAQEAPSGLLGPLVERLKGATGLLNGWKGGDSKEGSSGDIDLCFWLHALHRLAVAHGSALVANASHQQQRVLMWTLRDLIAHPGLQQFPETQRSFSDLTALLSDSIADDVRKQLVQRDAAKLVEEDEQCAFIFGRVPLPDSWLTLTQRNTTPSIGHAGSSPQTSNAGAQQYHGQGQSSPGLASLQRSVSQPLPQQSAQGHSQARTFSQYAQASKVLPQQLQRMGPNGQPPHGMQLHPMQQMHNTGPQRSMTAAAVQAQRAGGLNQGQGSGAKAASAKQETADLRQTPFTLNRWEVLPECGSNSLANETAISLNLFGARKV